MMKIFVMVAVLVAGYSNALAASNGSACAKMTQKMGLVEKVLTKINLKKDAQKAD